jgi:hypothetical protein
VRGEDLHVTQGLEWLRQQGVTVEMLSRLEEER